MNLHKNMKTEVKFRDLPEKVQGFLIRMFGHSDDSNPTIKLEWLHTLPEWSEATDDERMAYAEPEVKPLFKVGDRPEWTIDLIKQLPHGAKLRCAWKEHEFIYNGEEIIVAPNQSVYIKKCRQKHFFFSKVVGNYAKIVSLPSGSLKELEEKPEFRFVVPELIKAGDSRVKIGALGQAPKVDCRVISEENYQFLLSFVPNESQEGFVNANPDALICSNNSKEPKAGEIVDASDFGGFPYDETGMFCFTGGKTKEGRFICERLNITNGGLYCFKFLRLPQKSEVESKAKELWEKLGNEDLNAWEIVMQGIKWGQANPDKI